MAAPMMHKEAITPEPLLLHVVGRLVTTGRRKILKLTSNHAESARIRLFFEWIAVVPGRLKRAAGQLSPERVRALILSFVFVEWSRGRTVEAESEGTQMLLNLLPV